MSRRRRCAFCAKPLPKDARSNRKFCDATCRAGNSKARGQESSTNVRQLRAVSAADTQPKRPPTPKTVTQAADAGTPRELLVALRTRIAKQVEDVNCPPRDLASLSRRLLEIAKEIEAMDAAAEQEAAENAEADDEAFDAEAL